MLNVHNCRSLCSGRNNDPVFNILIGYFKDYLAISNSIE